jgi:hypothetical protein
MHPTSTHNEFVRLRVQGLSFAAILRVQGLSFAAIARRLGVSKPTLISWSKGVKPLLAASIAQEQQRAISDAARTVNQQLADLTRRHHALKQELLSRAFHDIPTAHIETLAGEYNQQIQNLNRNFQPPAEHPASSIQQPASSPEPIRT